jgi:hypothetical protein
MRGRLTVVELVPQSTNGIWAVPYHNRRKRKPERLPNGAIVESATIDQRREVPDGLPAYFECEGDCFIGLSGVFVLPSGQVGAIYGADTSRLGVAE